MNCRRAQHLLFDFLDGVSNESLRAEVDRHLGECEACDRFASEMTRSLALLHRVPMEPVDDNFNWKVRLGIHREKNAALERAASTNAWVRKWNVRYALSGGLAFGAVLVVGGVLFLRGGIVPAPVTLVDQPTHLEVKGTNNGPTSVPQSTFQGPARPDLMTSVSAGNSTSDVGPAPPGAIDEATTDARIDSLISSDVKKLSADERARYLQRRIDRLRQQQNQEEQPQR